MKRAEVWRIAACVAAGSLSVALSWGRWLDPIVDAGRDLYVPLQLANGASLYRDLAYNYPPFAPYALAALVRIFGSSLTLYIAAGLAVAGITAVALYLFVRRLTGIDGAFAATLMFVSFCIAGRPNFNFFFPYAHSMTLGAMFAMLFMATSWTAFGFLACATKIEFAAVAIAWAVSKRRWLAALLFAVAAFALTPFPSKLMHGASGFYSRLAIGDWRLIVTGTIILGCVGVLARVPRAIWIAPLFVFVSADTIFAATPVVHLALVPFLRRRPAMLPLWIASVVSTARIAFNVAPSFNGFAYVLPTIALFVYAAFDFFPKPLWIALFAGISLHALWRLPAPGFRVDTPRGSYVDADIARGEVVRDVTASIPPGTLAVIPEGVSINYFAGRTTSLRTYLFTPPEVEESTVLDFKAHPPDFVLFVPRGVAEYGSRGFGVDYAQSIAQYIAANYIRVQTFKSTYYAAELWRRR